MTRQLHPDSEKALQDIADKVPAQSRVVFVSGNFNIIHPGHLRLLKYASECGDFLVVGVRADGNGDSLLHESHRLDGVKANSYVNYSFILHDKPEIFIEHLKPAVVVKGSEHEGEVNPESKALQLYGGKLLFSSGEVRFSSLDLLKDEFRHLNYSTISQSHDYLERHELTIKSLGELLDRMSGLNVLVVGDLIVDEYITCDPLGMSQEDPTIVVTPVMNERFVGGAGIVAAHASRLGAGVNYYSIVGQDASAKYVKNQLEAYGVTSHLYLDENRPTSLKQRFRANGKTLLRVNHLRQTPIDSNIQKMIYSDVISVLDEADLLIFSDFNYGCLPQSLVDDLISACRKKDVMMVADSQSSSQIGDVSRFTGMELLTPTEREARLALKSFSDGLVILSEALRSRAEANNILLTLGAEGMLIHAASTTSDSGFVVDRLPALNTAPQDVSGAGDSLLTCTSMAMAAGGDIWASAYLGALGAACQVGRTGNIPLDPAELHTELSI